VKHRFEVAATQQSILIKEEKIDKEVYRIIYLLDDKEGDEAAIVNISAVNKIYYTPFTCMFLDCQRISFDQSGYAAEHTGQRTDPTTAPLAKYGPHVIIYVVFHGDHLGGMATCDCKTEGSRWNAKGLEVYELWERMKGDGLPANVKEIRLWACKGADAVGGLPFAEAFVRIMEEELEYQGTTVSSYSGYLTLTRNGKFSYSMRDDDSTKVRAKARRQTFRDPNDVWEPAQATIPYDRLLLGRLEKKADQDWDDFAQELSDLAEKAISAAGNRSDLQLIIFGDVSLDGDLVKQTVLTVTKLRRRGFDFKISRGFFQSGKVHVRIYDRLRQGVNF